MKDIIKILTVTVIFLGVGATVVSYGLQFGRESADNTVGGNGFSLDNSYYLSTITGSTVEGETSATTSVAYITADAGTSTVTGFIGSASELAEHIQFNASSTASKLIWINYFSHDGVDWFAENCVTATSNILNTHGTGPCVNVKTAEIAGIRRHSVFIGNVRAKYFKTDFSLHGGNGSLWVKAVPKDEVTN
jgi:hypothetical protein